MNRLASVVWTEFIVLGADALHLRFKSGGRRAGVLREVLEPIWLKAVHSTLQVLGVCRDEGCCPFGKLPNISDKEMWLHSVGYGDEMSSFQFYMSAADALGSRKQKVVTQGTNTAPLLN